MLVMQQLLVMLLLLVILLLLVLVLLVLLMVAGLLGALREMQHRLHAAAGFLSGALHLLQLEQRAF